MDWKTENIEGRLLLRGFSSTSQNVCRLLLMGFFSFAIWALICPMISRSAHKVAPILLVLLLLEGSGLLGLIFFSLTYAVISIGQLWVVQHVGTSPTLNSFR